MTPSIMELLGFGSQGWGLLLLKAAGVTLSAAVCGFFWEACWGSAGQP